jgi:hypothetical protein
LPSTPVHHGPAIQPPSSPLGAGNGTEEIVRCLRPQQRTLPLPSSWPPVTYESYKPWLSEDDHAHVFFGAHHPHAHAHTSPHRAVAPRSSPPATPLMLKQQAPPQTSTSPRSSGSINLVEDQFYPDSGFSADNDFGAWPNIVNVELHPVQLSRPQGEARCVGGGPACSPASLTPFPPSGRLICLDNAMGMTARPCAPDHTTPHHTPPHTTPQHPAVQARQGVLHQGLGRVPRAGGPRAAAPPPRIRPQHPLHLGRLRRYALAQPINMGVRCLRTRARALLRSVSGA